MFEFFNRSLTQKGYEIRAFNLADVDALQQLAIQTFRETYAHCLQKNAKIAVVHQEIEPIYSKQVLKEWLTDPNKLCLALVQHQPNSTFVGFSLLEFEGQHAFLSKLYLLNSVQGQGLGRILLEANFSELRERSHITEVKVDVWEENSNAIAFYEKMGFNAKGIKKAYAASIGETAFYDEEYTKAVTTL